MRLFFAIISCFVPALLASSPNQVEIDAIEFEPGTIYKYNYTGHVVTSAYPDHHHKTGYRLDLELLLRKDNDGWIVMKMVNPKLLRVYGPYSDMMSNSVASDLDEEFSRELAKPVRFLFKNGVFSNLETAIDDLFWSVNIKKGLIDLLQLDSRAKSTAVPSPTSPVHYATYEDGIKGLCRTSYTRLVSKPNQYSSSGASVVNITKVRNYEDCLTDFALVHHNMDQVGCSSEHDRAHNQDSTRPNSHQKHAKNWPIEQFSTYQYNITLRSGSPMIEGILNVGKIVLDTEGSNFITETQQTLQLVAVSKGRLSSVIFNPKTITYNSLSYKIWDPLMDKKPFLDIPYLHLFSYPEQSRLVEAASTYLDLLGSEIAWEHIPSSSKVGHNLGRLIEILSFLDHEHLFQVFSRLHKSSLQSVDYTKRQLFLDVVGSSGTNHVALLVEKLISERLVSNFEARNLVESFPRNLYHPARDTVEKYFNLVQQLHRSGSSSEVIVPVVLSWAQMVASLCGQNSTNEQLRKKFAPNKLPDQFSDPRFNKESLVRHSFDYHCSEQDIEKYSQTVHQWLKEDNNLNLKIVWAQTLVYFAHNKSLDLLEPYIFGSSEALRSFELSAGSQNKWEEFNFLRTSLIYALHNIVGDQAEYLRSVSLPIYENTNEPYELRLAAFTVFMASSPEEHEVESIANILRFEKNQEVISMVKSIIVNYSKLTSPCNQRIATIARHVLSSLPESTLEDEEHSRAEWNERYFSTQHFGINLDRQQVVSNVSYLPKAGYLNCGSTWASYSSKWFTLAFQQKGFHNVSFDDVNRPKSNPLSVLFNSKLFALDEAQETPRAKIFVKLFEKSSLFVLDDQAVREAVRYFEHRLSEMKSKSSDGKSFRLVKVLLPNSYRAVVPSDLGLPVYVHQNHPIILSVHVENAVVNKRTKSGHKLNFSARLVPFVWYRSIQSLQTINSGIHEATGAYSMRRGALNVSSQVSLTIEKGRFDYSFDPHIERAVFEHPKTVSFVSKTEIGISPQKSLLVSKKTLG